MSDNEFASTPRSRAALARMEAQERAEYEARRKAKIDAGLDPGEPRKPPPTGRGRQPANGNFEPAPALEPQPYLSALEAPWFKQAAAEARVELKRYWAPGGPADGKYPQQPTPWWPVTPRPKRKPKKHAAPQATPKLRIC